MKHDLSFHSLCRWTFNPGKGGFTPANIRPNWKNSCLSTVDTVELIHRKIRPRLPEWIKLGYEVHYDSEVNWKNAAALAKVLHTRQIPLAMLSPGAHSRFAYGGIASLDPEERSAADKMGREVIDLLYGPLRKAWHDSPDLCPTLVLWNGSYGYDIASIGVATMYHNLKQSVAGLVEYEKKKGGLLRFAIEPKPNEGHPAMLLPTVASALLFWKRLKEEYGIPLDRTGVNKEFGHTEMAGLDLVYDTVEEIDNHAVQHMHLNGQGYNDGIILGGPGKYDIDHGVRINGINITVAGLVKRSGYSRWKGHDILPRAYDNEQQALNRIVRSILSWEACAQAANNLDNRRLMAALTNRDTAEAEDQMRAAVVFANKWFDEQYR